MTRLKNIRVIKIINKKEIITFMNLSSNKLTNQSINF